MLEYWAQPPGPGSWCLPVRLTRLLLDDPVPAETLADNPDSVTAPSRVSRGRAARFR